MGKGRLEAFSDGVIAIIITIMVLDMKAPHSADLASLRAVLPAFISYVLSYLYMGIYWNNHHHLFQVVERVNGATLWANLHLLFWLSLIPFVTRWMGDSHFGEWPVAVYGVVLLMSAVAWYLECRVLLRIHDEASPITLALTGNAKEWLSVVIYAVAIGLAFFNAYLAAILYAAVALLWIVPDRRLEHVGKRTDVATGTSTRHSNQH